MSRLERMIAAVAPGLAVRRAQRRAALMHYDAAGVGPRSSSFRASRADADTASRRRERLAFNIRDMARNNPFAVRAIGAICSNTVGAGIIPAVRTADPGFNEAGLQLVQEMLDAPEIDALGRANLYGLQREVISAVATSGEVLVVRRKTRPGRFTLQVMECDHLDTARDGFIAANGDGYVHQGIEYDRAGRVAAYWLFPEHPGSDRIGAITERFISERVPARDVAHVYRADRPGQRRGVSWLAPVAMRLQDLDDYLDAQGVRQKVAALLVGVRTGVEGAAADDDPFEGTMMPGTWVNAAEGEEITFSAPPQVDGLDTYVRTQLGSVAAGVGITYEALTGDLARVNFASGRMGRMEMDRNIEAWQWLMLEPQLLQRVAGWFREAWIEEEGAMKAGADRIARIAAAPISWTPPARIIVDPAREIPAMGKAIRLGLASRQGTVRGLGHDPQVILREQAEDRAAAVAAGLTFDSDPDATTAAGAAQSTDDAGPGDAPIRETEET